MNGFRRHAVVVVMIHLCGFIVLRIDHCTLMGFIGAGGAVSFPCAVLLGSGLRRRAVALAAALSCMASAVGAPRGEAFLRTVAVPGSQFRAQHRRTDAAGRNLPPAAGSAGSQHKRKQRHGQRRRPPWGGLSLFCRFIGVSTSFILIVMHHPMHRFTEVYRLAISRGM